jgi:hypothetical protein
MKAYGKHSRFLIGTLALCLASGAPAVVLPALAASGQQAQRGDSEIQSDVAYQLSTSQQLQGQAITAATIDGTVTLSGNVKDEASKKLAQTLAARVNGVRSVENNLTVGDQQQPAAGNQQNQNQPAQDQTQDQGPDPADANMAPVTGDQNDQQAAANQNAQAPADQNQPPADQTAQAPAEQYPAPQQAPPPPPARSQAQYPAPNQAPYQPAPRYPNPSVQNNSGPVTIPQGTLIRARLSETLDTRRTKPGQFFEATAANDVYVGGVLAIPRGAVLQGAVVDVKNTKGELKGSSGFALNLNSITLQGQQFGIVTDNFTTQGPGKGAYTASNTVGGAAIGALIGAIAGRGTGAAIGAVAGGATGAAVSSATSGPNIILPAESLVTFHLAQPATVQPVSSQEAQRLAASVPPERPRPYPYARPRPAYYYGYPYPYPPPPPPPPGYYYYRY